MGGNFGKGKSRTTMNKLPRHANVGCLHDQVGFLNRVKTWRWRDIYLRWDFILFENVCLNIIMDLCSCVLEVLEIWKGWGFKYFDPNNKHTTEISSYKVKAIIPYDNRENQQQRHPLKWNKLRGGGEDIRLGSIM